MCWKYEWARAIANIEWAIIHCQRAQEKVRRRNNRAAEEETLQTIRELTRIQETLKGLIEKYGISRTDSRQAEKIMKGHRTKKGKVASWVEKY